MSDWRPIETAPRDGTVIQRWHSIWKAPISVRYKVGVLKDYPNLCWWESTWATGWPDQAFTPHWRPLPDPPASKG